MTNRDIAKQFSLLGKLMELHEESPFKYKSYNNAYLTIRKLPIPLVDMPSDEILGIQGIGKAVAAKIQELLENGSMQTLEKYLDKTPDGIIKMLTVKGFGPKKIGIIWKELKIETIGELLYAINENRLVDLKGFGVKTQQTLKEQLEYFVESSDKHLYAYLIEIAENLVTDISKNYTDHRTVLTGALHRKCQIIDQIDILTTLTQEELEKYKTTEKRFSKHNEQTFIDNFKVYFHHTTMDNFVYDHVKSSSTQEFWSTLKAKEGIYKDENEFFGSHGKPYVIPELRERIQLPNKLKNIIDHRDIRGCIHNHSTYSDGVNTMQEMVNACIEKGYEYFVITDHSKSAFYANGLSEERLLKQIDEIASLDQEYSEIRFFSGIESDILSDGSLDYSDEILGQLDVVVASIHSNLKMDEEKATKRLITAIENPFTSILGHPTGRLLLSRKGYPIDHKKIIDACAANNVAIELNANPNRLDMDWTHIDYAMEKDVLISINPDAHSIAGLDDMQYGVHVARKGGLGKYQCLNAFDLEDFEEWLYEQHQKRG